METVRKKRVERGWTQQKLAQRARTSQCTIDEIEQGRQDPHPTTLRKIAEAFGVSEAELLAEEPYTPQAQDGLPVEHAHQRDSALIKALRTYFRDLRLRWKEPANKPTLGQIRDALDLLQHLTDHGAFNGTLTLREQNEVDLLMNVAHKLRPLAEELAEENEAAWLDDVIEEAFEGANAQRSR